MRLCIVHLSDCHFRIGQSKHEELLGPLVKAVAANKPSPDELVLAITGDVAFSGKPDEFEIGKRMIAIVRDQLASSLKIPVHCAIVPGNHDCDLLSEPAARTAVLSSVGSGAAWDASIPAACTSVQKSFFEFAAAANTCLQLGSTELIANCRLKIGTQDIVLWGVNSAWMSQLHEQPGSLWFPVHQLQQHVEDAGPAVNVLLLHHPFAWFKTEVRREFLLLVDCTFDLVLGGHEHVTDAWVRDDAAGQRTLVIEGGVLQEHGAQLTGSTFNLITLDLEVDSSTLAAFSLEFDGKQYVPGAQKSASIDAGRHKVRSHRVLSEQCLSYLRSAGATYRHPDKPGALELQDIYVEPDLVDLESARDANVVEKRVSTATVLTQIQKNPYLALGGAEKAGKSAWLRWAYLRLHDAGLTPVRIEGSFLRSDDLQRTIKLIESEYKQQYAAKDSVTWSQLDSGSKALLIDDFDASRLNRERRKAILHDLRRMFGVVLITCDDTLLLGDGPDSEFEGFRKYQFPEFGHRLRDHLIGKWLRLGRAGTLEVSAFQVQREQRVRAINALLGQSFVPPRPIFLLTLLQSMDMGADASVRGSSLGEYYEYLIRHALIGARVETQDLGAVLNYLTEMSYFVLSQNSPSLDSGMMAEFDATFSKRYDIRMRFQSLHKQLQEADILEEWGDQVRFKYRYVLLFFGARYLARNFGQDPEVTRQVRALGRNLAVSKYADLMMFVVHHSHDPVVLDIILEEADKAFSDMAALRLDESDTAQINSLVTEIPRLALTDEPAESRRERRLRARDEKEAATEDREESDLSLAALEESLVVEATDYAQMTASALRVLAILGQVLRNYYGSLRAERKEQIATASYALLARMLRSHVSIVCDDQESLIDALAQELEKRSAQTPDKTRAVANRLVFGLLSLIVFVFVKRTSEFLGSDKLLPTHEKVSGAVATPLSRLLGVAISLDYPVVSSTGQPRPVPLNDLQLLHDEFEKNPCADWVLRRLVLDYLYMFEVSYKDKQRICDALGISTRRQQQIQMLSQRKRKSRSA